MVIADFTDIRVLIIFIVFYLVLNCIGYAKKNAWFPMISVLMSISFLIGHFAIEDMQTREIFKYNVFADLTFLAINIPVLMIVDEIESRRIVIKSVFENRYKKSKK